MRENGAFDFRARRGGDNADGHAGGNVGWQPYRRLAAGRGAVERRVRARARLVSQFPLHAGTRARPRLRRGPGVARHLPVRLRRAATAAAGAARRCRPRRRCSLRGCTRARRRDGTPCVVVGARSRARNAISRAAATAPRSSPATRGSATGGATPSSRCAGLALARGRLDLAQSVLVAWSGAVSEGMLPNRFPDHGETPEYNAVDASLWYVIAVFEFLHAASPSSRRAHATAGRRRIDPRRLHTRDAFRHPDGRRRLARVRGSRRAAHVDGCACRWPRDHAADRQAGGGTGTVDQRAATWRAAPMPPRRNAPAPSFRARFWNADAGCLFDVVDVDHVPGRNDPAVRPNQLFAIGGLPDTLVDAASARAIVDVVERELLTPAGIRTLSPKDRRVLRAIRGRCFPARRGVSPGHGVAVADGRLRRCVAARAWRQRRHTGGGARTFPRAVAGALRGVRIGPRRRDRRWRCAACAARLPVPGVVRRRTGTGTQAHGAGCLALKATAPQFILGCRCPSFHAWRAQGRGSVAAVGRVPQLRGGHAHLAPPVRPFAVGAGQIQRGRLVGEIVGLHQRERGVRLADERMHRLRDGGRMRSLRIETGSQRRRPRARRQGRPCRPRASARAPSKAASDVRRSACASSRSTPFHQPATVGRSCVDTHAAASAGYRAGGRNAAPSRSNHSGGTTARGRFEHRAKSVGHGAEILADDGTPRALALQREHAEQIVQRIAHVGTLGGRCPVRNPEQARQAHDVIDAQRTGVPHVGMDQRAKCGVAVLGERVRQGWRQVPDLPHAREWIRRRANGNAARERAWVDQASAPSGAAPTARSRQQAERQAAARAAAAARPTVVGEPLQVQREAQRARVAARNVATPSPSGVRNAMGQSVQRTRACAAAIASNVANRIASPPASTKS